MTQKIFSVIGNYVKVFPLAIFLSISCSSQTLLQFDEVKGNDISTCQESIDGIICQSKFQLEIWLTNAAPLVGKYETISLTFDGNNWEAKKYKGDWIKNTVDTIKLQPLYTYDTLFSTLKKNRIFVLPDQKDLALKSSVDDGNEYSLTFRAGNKFRNYEFENPDMYIKFNKNVPELKNYINIVRILSNWLKEKQ